MAWKNAEAAALAKSERSTATVILIPRALRMEWVDVMALDTVLTDAEVRVALVVGTYINRFSGDTFVSQETLASVMGVSPRKVFGALKGIEAAGYLVVKRGSEALPADRKRRSAGRGVANVYVPSFDKSQISACYRSEKFAKYCDLIWQKNLFKPQKTGHKPARSSDPTLSDPSDQNSSGTSEPMRVEALGPLGPRLAARVGPDVFKSWFSRAVLFMSAGGTWRIELPTAFLEERVRRDYADVVLRCCKEIDSSVVAIRFAVGDRRTQ